MVATGTSLVRPSCGSRDTRKELIKTATAVCQPVLATDVVEEPSGYYLDVTVCVALKMWYGRQRGPRWYEYTSFLRLCLSTFNL